MRVLARTHHSSALKSAFALGLALCLALSAAACSDDGGAAVVDDVGGTTDVPAAPVVTYTAWPINDGVFKKPLYHDSCRYKSDDNLLEWATNGAADDTFTLAGPPNGPVTLGLSVIASDGEVLTASLELADRSQTGRSWYTAAGTATFGVGLARGADVIDGTLCLETRTDTGADIPAEFSLILDEGGVISTIGGSLIIPAAAVAGSDPISVSTTAADIDLR